MPMDTLASARICHHTSLRIATSRPTEFLDLTDQLERLVSDSHLDVGVLTVQTRHTTTALIVNEHEPLLLADFEQLLERAAPRELAYWHDELPLRPGVSPDEPRNGHAHCRALLLPSSALLTIAAGRLQLGRWQRVFLVEFDGPRERELSVVIMGEVVSCR
jgi:secondary thiamine-phosphate synthase enzyme